MSRCARWPLLAAPTVDTVGGVSLSTAVRLSPLALTLALGACAAEHPLQLSPERGSQAGGEAVRISGEDFVGHGPVAVYFGPRAAKAIVIESAWLITVLTPQTDNPGTVDVLLRFGDGEERTLTEAYQYDEQQGIILRPEIGG